MLGRKPWVFMLTGVLLSLTGCLSFDYKSVGYLEPGGTNPGASKISGKNCDWAHKPIIYRAIENALNAQSGTVALKNAELVVTVGVPPCAEIQGEPVREDTTK
jgi:hypothetical protein